MDGITNKLGAIDLPKRSEREIEDILVSKTIEAIRAIVSDTQMRMAHYEEDHKLLDAGIFYPDEYFKALTCIDQSKRIDFLVKKGSFWHGFAPTKCFEMVPIAMSDANPTGVIGCCFVLKKGVLPTEALASLHQKVTLVGCAEACQIAYYEAISFVLGADKFNKLFAADSLTPLKIGQSRLLKNPIGCLIRRLPLGTKIAKGQIHQFTNTPGYRGKHITGSGASFITLCCDDTPGKETFTTLGLKPEGATHIEVQDALIAEFNKPPLGVQSIPMSLIQRMIKKSPETFDQAAKLKKIIILSRAELIKTQGGHTITQAELGVGRIAALANADFEGARLLLYKWVFLS